MVDDGELRASEDEPREALCARIRFVLAAGMTPDQAARAVVGLFTLVDYRNQDLDVTALSDSRRTPLRQRWLVCTVAAGPARSVDGGPQGALPFGLADG